MLALTPQQLFPSIEHRIDSIYCITHRLKPQNCKPVFLNPQFHNSTILLLVIILEVGVITISTNITHSPEQNCLKNHHALY